MTEVGLTHARTLFRDGQRMRLTRPESRLAARGGSGLWVAIYQYNDFRVEYTLVYTNIHWYIPIYTHTGIYSYQYDVEMILR
jgi:hypothetical protein